MPYLVLVEAKVVSDLVPDGVPYCSADRLESTAVFVCEIEYRQTIQRYGVGQYYADAIGVATYACRYTVVVPEQCLIVCESLALANLGGWFVLYEKCDILDAGAELFGYGIQKFLF